MRRSSGGGSWKELEVGHDGLNGQEQSSSLASLEPGLAHRPRANFWVRLRLALPNGPHLASLEPRQAFGWGPGLAYLMRTAGQEAHVETLALRPCMQVTTECDDESISNANLTARDVSMYT